MPHERGCPRYRVALQRRCRREPFDALGLPSPDRAAHAGFGEAALIAGAVAAIIGAGVTAYGMYAQSQAQGAIAAYNARLVQQQAQAEYAMQAALAQQQFGLMEMQAQFQEAQAGLMEQQGGFALASAEFQQKLAEKQAESVTTQTALMQEDVRRRLGRTQAAARVGIALAGVESTGSPLNLLLENASEAQREITELRYGGELQVASIMAGAQLELEEGRARQAAAFGDAALTRFGANLTRMGGANQLASSLMGGQLGLQSAGSQASLLRFQGGAARQAGYWGAGSSLLSGFGQAASIYGTSQRYGGRTGGYSSGSPAFG